MTVEQVATLSAGLFAGAATYISVVEHWARLAAGPAVALAQFRPGFPRARALQGSLASLGGACAAFAWLGGSGGGWLVVALLLFGIVGFTLLVIAPVYGALVSPALAAESPDAARLLARWGRLHAVRTLAGLLAFTIAVASG